MRLDPDRQSNFPVDRACVSYGVLWNAFKRVAAPYSAEARASLFHGTAARVYARAHASVLVIREHNRIF